MTAHTLALLGSWVAIFLLAYAGRRQGRSQRARTDQLETRQRLNFEWLWAQLKTKTKQPTVNVKKTVAVDYAAGIESDGHWNEDLSRTRALTHTRESGFRPRTDL